MKKRGKNKKVLGKKAQSNEIYHILFQVIIAIMVYWTLQSYLDSVAKDTLFEKSYLSKDLALLINTIYGSPGEVDYVYTNQRAELDKFEFDFNDQKVSVIEIKAKEPIEVIYPYGEDITLIHSKHKIYDKTQIEFFKNETDFKIS